MAEFYRFLPLVLPYAMTCPEPVAEAHLRWAAIDFCEATRPWRYVDTLTTTGVNPEPIGIPAGSEIHQIEEAWFDERKLDRVSYVDGSPYANMGEGMPSVIYQDGPDAVVLSPTTVGSLRISLFLKPAVNANTLPDFFLSQYAQAIANGALARILMIPDQPFSEPQRAAVFAAAFERAKAKNFRAGSAGQQRAPRRTHARYF